MKIEKYLKIMNLITIIYYIIYIKLMIPDAIMIMYNIFYYLLIKLKRRLEGEIQPRPLTNLCLTINQRIII